MNNKTILLLTLPLLSMLIIVSCVGLLEKDFYASETTNWHAQCIGQDLVDLLIITPVLFLATIFATRGNVTGRLIWGGVMLYLTYTFILYCFDVQFNKLFILYCFCLGLSFYSLMYYLFTPTIENSVDTYKNSTLNKTISLYFISIAVLFYALWLAEIIPAIYQNTKPKSLVDVGLPTNGVHVIDLAIFLPLVFITGFSMVKQKALGHLLTPILLTFFVLMDITIGVLAVVMKWRGIESNLALTGIMFTLAMVSGILLFLYIKNAYKTISYE